MKPLSFFSSCLLSCVCVAQQTVNIDLCAGFQNLVRVSGANVASFGLSASAVNCGTPAGPKINITVTGNGVITGQSYSVTVRPLAPKQCWP